MKTYAAGLYIYPTQFGKNSRLNTLTKIIADFSQSPKSANQNIVYITYENTTDEVSNRIEDAVSNLSISDDLNLMVLNDNHGSFESLDANDLYLIIKDLADKDKKVDMMIIDVFSMLETIDDKDISNLIKEIAEVACTVNIPIVSTVQISKDGKSNISGIYRVETKIIKEDIENIDI